MKKYLIRTEIHRIGSDKINSVFYRGTKKFCAVYAPHSESLCQDNGEIKMYAEHFGYSNKKAAINALESNNESKNFVSTSKLIEFEI